jgi:hypothetical protein
MLYGSTKVEGSRKDKQALALKRNFLEEVQDAQSKSKPVLSKTRTPEEQAGTVLAQTDSGMPWAVKEPLLCAGEASKVS